MRNIYLEALFVGMGTRLRLDFRLEIFILTQTTAHDEHYKHEFLKETLNICTN